MKQFHRSSFGTSLMIAAALWVLGAAAFAGGVQDFQDTRPGSSQALVLERGRSVMLKFKGLRRVAVVHPEVADVSVMSANELVVMATAKPIKDQDHTMLYVWDKDGLHNFAVTVVGMRLAERIANDLRESLSPNLNVEVVSDTMVVVEGDVVDQDAKENLESMLEAASTEEVRVVGMIVTREDRDSPASSVAEALSEILDPALQVTAFGRDVLAVEGELPSKEAADRARSAMKAVGAGLRIVDMITVAGEAAGPQVPVAELQELLGDEFTVTALSGNAVAVDGIVENDRELDRINRLLEAYQDVQTVNLVQVVPPKPDLEAASRAVQAAVGEGIEVSRVGDEGLMMEGSVPTEEELDQLSQVTGMFEGRVPILNLVTVVEPDRRQVLVAVKVMEVTSGDADELGIDWGQYSATTSGPLFRQQPFLMGQISGLSGWRELYNFSTQIHALIDQQKAQILSEPNLLVNEEEEAEILIGGEIPVPIAQSGVGGAASVTVEWKPFGVTLNIKPSISPDNERIKLEVNPEVSSLDFGNGVTVGGLSIPAMRTRRAETIVTIADGGVLAIGGLIQSDQSESVSKIPVLGDLPIIGQFFRHNSTRTDKSELMILVMPQVLGEDGKPLHPLAVPEELDREGLMQFGPASGAEAQIDE